MAPGNTAAKVKSRFKCVSKAMQSIKLYSTSTHNTHSMYEVTENHIYRASTLHTIIWLSSLVISAWSINGSDNNCLMQWIMARQL